MTMAAIHDRERSLQREISQRVESGLPGVEVLAVELSGPERFCVYVDHAAGVDHALCERVTNLLRDYLDRYTIDVSSPGLERPLRTRAHFANVVGRRVAVRTAGDIDGRKRFRGELVAVAEGAVTVQTSGDAFDIPYESIVRGNLIDEG
jgi:ribosome maturation factor RimP